MGVPAGAGGGFRDGTSSCRKRGGSYEVYGWDVASDKEYPPASTPPQEKGGWVVKMQNEPAVPVRP